MKFLADESVDADIVRRIRANGHHCDYIAEMSPGIADEAVLKKAVEAGALLITADKDFGELVFLKKKRSLGIILLRLAGLSRSNKAALVVGVIDRYGTRLGGCFAVVARDAIRIRKEL